MILYTNNGNKVKCIKVKQPPKINSKNDYWDNFERDINDQKTKFWFTVRTNRCYFYFMFQGEWYKTDMNSVDGVDLWHYLQEQGEGLFDKYNVTEKAVDCLDNVVDMFGIAILEHDGFEDPFDNETQYKVKKWFLEDMKKYTDKWAVIGFNGTLKVYEENGDEIFNGTLLDSACFVNKLKEKIG